MSAEQSVEQLEKLLKEDATNFQARRELVVLLMDLGDNAGALKHLNYLISVFPDDARLYYNAGIAWEKIRETEKAKDSYLKALELSPDEPDFLYNFGNLLAQIGEYKKAIELFKAVLRKDPKDSDAYFNLGYVYVHLNNSEAAIKCFENAITLNSDDVLAIFYMANEYKKQGHIEKAISLYNDVLEKMPEYSWAYYNLAVVYNELQDYERTIFYLQKTIDTNPLDVEAVKLLIKIYARFKQPQNAISVAKALLEKQTNGDVYYLLAQIYENAGDITNAKKAITKAIENFKTLSVHPKVLKNKLQKLP